MNQRNNGSDKGMWILGGLGLSSLGLGAGLMYLFDPDRGNRRRAMLRDKWTHTVHQAGDAVSSVGGAFRDLSNRSYGVLAETKHWLRREMVDDDTLVARLRSQLGHAISQPGLIEVSANDGNVTLSGSIPANELNDLFSCVSGVQGVKEVESHLKVQSPSGKARSAAQAA